jgi:streptogramin lyase
MAMNPPGSNNNYPLPGTIAPLGLQGHSLQYGLMTVNEGQWSNVSEVIRLSTQAKTLDNFQMLTRGIWSSPTGIGWQPQRPAAFNGGAAFLDFGVFEDFVGNQTLLFQVGDTVYNYNFVTSTETAYDAPLNSLSTSIVNLPCMRPFVDNTGDAAPITIYCNGDIQPQQITGLAPNDVSALPFVGTGTATNTNPNGGQFDINYPITTFSPGTVIANYHISSGATPQNCCLGPDGNVWFTDYANSAICKITPLGIVTSYPTPTGGAGPYGICLGPDGNLWFTETLAQQIGVCTPAGAITEYGTAVVPQPTGICSGPNGYLWVVAAGSDVWHSYNTSGVSQSANAAPGHNWQSITTGPDGNLWAIGLTYNSIPTVAKYIPGTGFTNYSSAANVGTQSYSIISGVDGRLWFADFGTNQIGTITTAGVFQYYKLPSTSTNANPWGICNGSDGNIWFTENGANKLGRVDVTKSYSITEYVGLPVNCGLQGICTGQDGNVWFCEENNAAIGTAIVDTSNPRGITVGPDGRLWFAEYGTNKIGALTVLGVLTEYPLPNALSGPFDICSDGTDLWFTEFQGNRIGRITVTGTITEYALATPNSQPVGICFGPDGNIWFTESNNNKVANITTGGTITEYAIPTVASVPWGICSNGVSLFFCESVGNNIGKCSTGGAIIEYAVPTASAMPLWIADGSDSRLWFTEYNGNRIGAMTTTGMFTEYIIPTASAFPEQIAAASDGNLYFAEAGANQIGRITTAGAITEYPIDVNNAEPFGIVDGPDQSIWFTMNGASQIGNFLYGGSGTWPGVFQLTKKTYSKPRFCVYFNNRMAYFGFDQTTNAALDVLISNQGTAASFTTSAPIQATDAVTFTIPGLGLPTGLTAFRLTNTNNQEVLILGFQRGIAVVMGNSVSSDATTYAADILTYEYGLMSNRTFNQVQNDMYFLSTNGVRNFSNLTINANLLNAALTYQMQDVITSIVTVPTSDSNILVNSQAFAVHHRETLEIQYWFPAYSDVGHSITQYINGHAIILNYNVLQPVAQTITPIFSTKSGTNVACGIEFQGVMYGGGYDGLLQQHYTGNTYNGAAIMGTIETALINSGNIQMNMDLRQGLVVTEGENQLFQIATYFYEKQQDGTLLRTLSPEGVQVIGASVQGDTILGDVQYIDWTLGYSAFPANHIKQVYFEATGEGPYCEFLITTNGVTQSLDFAGIVYTVQVGGLRP